MVIKERKAGDSMPIDLPPGKKSPNYGTSLAFTLLRQKADEQGTEPQCRCPDEEQMQTLLNGGLHMARPFYIDDEECIGEGSCADICPHCFSFEAGMTVAKVMRFDCAEEEIEAAMHNCPAQCIHWEDED